MKIYLDESYRCHTSPGEGRTEAETDFFEGKAPEFVEGYRYVPAGSVWVRSDGAEFQGEMVAPWKPWAELDSIQRAYEREQYNDLLTKLSEVYEDAES